MACIHIFLKKRLLHRWKPLIILILVVLFSSACQPNRYFDPPCDQYCVTGDRIFSEAWYSCYKRGIACMNGECWDYARGELGRALRIKKIDERWVPTYGMHRLPEYFPNRELGIVYYRLNDFELALKYLLMSLEQEESAKAKYFINKIRKETLLITQEDKEPPRIFIDPNVVRITVEAETALSGKAVDDTFIANVIIQVNNDDPLSFLELSHPLAYSFEKTIRLRPGLNNISVKAIDLLGKEKEEKIEILCDQEGPMVYFAEGDGGEFPQQSNIEGLLYDPSDIKEFLINENRVELVKITLDEVLEDMSSFEVYKFQYPLSSEEWAKGILEYKAEDSLKNSTSGTISILEQETNHAQAAQREPLSLKLASLETITDPEDNPYLNLIAMRRRASPIRIEIDKIPSESYEAEITMQINIITSSDINEISIDDKPILSIYGVNWARFFPIIVSRLFGGEKGARCSFQRILKLQEGDNRIKIEVIDAKGISWEREVHIKRKIRQIRKINERWRFAIPFILHNIGGQRPERKNKELTFQLIEAFLSQERFKIVEFEKLSEVVREKNLYESIGIPFLGLNEKNTIGIDAVLISYFESTKNSFNLVASLVELETGEVLVTKDVFEEVNFFTSLEVEWNEDLRERAFNNCCVLSAKFKHYFPLCEGKIIDLSKNKIRTNIQRKDGLKEGMKLLIFDDQKPYEDFPFIGEARVDDVQKAYSYADILKNFGVENSGNDILINYAVITR